MANTVRFITDGEVYETKGYNNTSNAFEGISAGRFNIQQLLDYQQAYILSGFYKRLNGKNAWKEVYLSYLLVMTLIKTRTLKSASITKSRALRHVLNYSRLCTTRC
jgi:hypothetical protein